MSFLIANAYADAPAATTTSTTGTLGTAAPSADLVGTVVPFVFIFVVFYFLILRPQQRKFKLHQAMVSAIKRGDEVVTSGGIVGKVARVEDNGIIQVEIAKDVVVKVLASTVSGINDNSKPLNDNAASKK